jgi:type VI secretion system secreted protein Hcp
MRDQRRSPFLVPLVCTLLALPCSALAAIDMFLQAAGFVQGSIAGDATAVGHENWIQVLAFSHGVSTPIGPDGQPTGPPETQPLSMTVYFDRATTKLATAQSTDETFSNWKFEVVYLPGSAATIRVEMDNARVIGWSWGGSGGEDRLTANFTFAYTRVKITDVVRGTTVSYDWHSAPAATAPTLAKGILLTPAPNPTHGQTEFRFSLPADSNAQLALFDLRGHLVRELHHGWTSAEPTVAVWDGTDDGGKRVAQGMYVARLTYPGREVTQRITVLR